MKSAQREEYLKRLELEKERVARIQQQRTNQLEEKRRVQAQLEKEKAEVLKQFEKKKAKLAGGINKAEIDSLLESSVTPSITRKTLAPVSSSHTLQTKSLSAANLNEVTQSTPQPGSKAGGTHSKGTSNVSQSQKLVQASNSAQKGKVVYSSSRKVDVTPYLSSTPRSKASKLPVEHI